MKNIIALLLCCFVVSGESGASHGIGQKNDCTPSAPIVTTKIQSPNNVIVSWHPNWDDYDWTKDYDKKDLEGLWIKYIELLEQSGVDSGKEDYEIYRATGTLSEKLYQEGEYRHIATTNSIMPYTDSGLSEGAIYFYKVKTVNKCGESELSKYSVIKVQTNIAVADNINKEEKRKPDVISALPPVQTVQKPVSANAKTIDYNIALSFLREILIGKQYILTNSNKYIKAKDKKVYYKNKLYTGLAAEINSQNQEIIIANLVEGILHGEYLTYNYIKELKKILNYKYGTLIDSTIYPLVSDIVRKEEKKQIDSGGYYAFEPPLFYGKDPVLRRGEKPKKAGLDDKMRDVELTRLWFGTEDGGELFVSGARNTNIDIMGNWGDDFYEINKRYPAQIEFYKRFNGKVETKLLDAFVKVLGEEEINALKRHWLLYCNNGTNLGVIRMRQEAVSLGLIPDLNPSLLKFFEEIKFERCQ